MSVIVIQTYIYIYAPSKHNPRKRGAKQLGRLMSASTRRWQQPQTNLHRVRLLMTPQQIADRFNATFRPQSSAVLFPSETNGDSAVCVRTYMWPFVFASDPFCICISNVRNVFINNIHPLLCRMHASQYIYVNSIILANIQTARYLITVDGTASFWSVAWLYIYI